MPYALFVEDQQISRALPTAHDVWHYADDAGLVVDALIQDETSKPERILEQGYSIRQAEADQAGPDQAEPDQAKPDQAKPEEAKPQETKPLPGIEIPKRVA